MTPSDLINPKVIHKSIPVPKYAWVILFIALFASVAAPLNQFKVPPLLPVLIERFHLDLGTAGLLMSIFAITGFVLALPAGVILQKLGPRRSGLVAVGFLVVGSGLGALSASAGLLFFSRLIEGAGMGLIAVVAPAAISSWFPADKRGAPMGIWATWVPLGNLIMFNVAPVLGLAAGWQAVWWAGAAFALAAFILYGLFMRLPPAIASPTPANENNQAAAAPGLRQALSNRRIWLIGLAFASFNLVAVGVIATYYPTFLATQRNFPLTTASSISSLSLVVGVILAPCVGWLMDRLGTRRPFVLVSFITYAIWMIFPFSIPGGWVLATLLIMGIITVSVPVALFSAAPELMGSPQLAGIGMGVMILCQNLGQLLGPILFGRLVESAGWVTAGFWMIPILLAGLAAVWAAKIH